MKIVIMGIGKIGETLIKHFAKDKYDIVCIDCDGGVVNKVVNHYDVMGVIGSGIESETMKDAEVADADFFIACASRDEVNVLSCSIAKKLGAKRTVARVRDPKLFGDIDNLKEYLGIDLAFNPEYRAALDVAEILKFPSALSVESFADGKAVMVEFSIGEDSPLIGKSMVDVASLGYKLLFAVAKRGEKYILPKGDFVIEKNDNLYVIADEEEIKSFCKKLHIFKSPVKSVFIIGGGKIGYYLAKELSDKNVTVKLIEKDRDRAGELSELLPKVSVICGDATEQSNLDEENFESVDACVTATGIDEVNVIISLCAINRKISKVVTKIDRENVNDMVESLGLDSIVAPKNSIADYIIGFVRAYQVKYGEGINALYKLGDNVETLEFTVNEGFENTGVAIKNLKIRSNVLIGGIVRNEELIIPNGESKFEVNDKVIIITMNREFNEFTEIFK